MILQKMPLGTHACLLYSVAMLLGERVQQLLEEMKIDPNQVIWDHLPPPHCYRGVNIEEIQDLLLKKRRMLASIRAYPVIAPTCKAQPVPLYGREQATRRLVWYLDGHDCILEGLNRLGIRHAVACADGRIYDPIGREYSLDDININVETVYVLTKPV